MTRFWLIWIALALFAAAVGTYNGVTIGWTSLRLVLAIGGVATAIAWVWLVFDDRT